jgi:hypothetical protein
MEMSLDGGSSYQTRYRAGVQLASSANNRRARENLSGYQLTNGFGCPADAKLLIFASGVTDRRKSR